ncbi:MAG: peptidoglycan-binding domain-containing protein [Alphaproteobacteria bacterium]|nr:peptidoglycan-binding domain-containing protein [Alphaproteobacteria bacterium]
MRKPTATTVLFACFLALAPASYAPAKAGDSTCQAAGRDYFAAETARRDAARAAGDAAAQGIDNSTVAQDRFTAAHDRARAAGYAAARERIPASCNCLVALAAANEALWRAGQRGAHDAINRANDDIDKAVNCLLAERERQAQAEREQQRPAQEAAQPAPDPVRNMAVDFEKLERSLSLRLDQRANIQRALNAMGHDAGSADGIFGPRTRKAIKAMQKALGVEPTGYLNIELLRHLSDMEQATQTAGTLAPANTCVSAKTLGKVDSVGHRLREDYENYSIEVQFTNGCAHEAEVSYRYLIGLKAQHKRGKPIKCSNGFAIDLEPGESETVSMGPLPRGITQKYAWCVHYDDSDTQKRTGYRTCYAAGQPRCPPVP